MSCCSVSVLTIDHCFLGHSHWFGSPLLQDRTVFQIAAEHGHTDILRILVASTRDNKIPFHVRCHVSLWAIIVFRAPLSVSSSPADPIKCLFLSFLSFFFSSRETEFNSRRARRPEGCLVSAASRSPERSRLRSSLPSAGRSRSGNTFTSGQRRENRVRSRTRGATCRIRPGSGRSSGSPRCESFLFFSPPRPLALAFLMSSGCIHPFHVSVVLPRPVVSR